MRRPVTAEEKAFIVEHCHKMTVKEIAVRLHRATKTISWLIRELGCVTTKTAAKATEREIAFIRAHARTWPLDRIAFELKRLPAFVAAVCEQEGIT